MSFWGEKKEEEYSTISGELIRKIEYGVRLSDVILKYDMYCMTGDTVCFLTTIT